jgi:cytochrome b6-f complex iron-sulfur subunit
MAEGRRSFVQWMLGGGFSASILSFVYPAIRFLKPPPATEASVNEAPAGQVGDLKPNTAKIVKFGARPVILLRTSETEWKAFSAVCTHLNCTVQFNQAKRQIWCACHNGYYDLNGAVASGPPPRPLQEFTVHLRAGEVIISRRA